MNWINSNIQLYCYTTSSASLLMSMFVTRLTSFNFILVTTLFVTLTKNYGILQRCFANFTLFKTVCLLKFSKIDASTWKFYFFKTKLNFWFWCCDTLDGIHHITRWATIETRMYFNYCRTRNSLPQVFLGKDVLKIRSKFTRGHPCRSVISEKLQSNFIKISLQHGCFPVNLLHIFRILFLNNTSGGLLL